MTIQNRKIILFFIALGIFILSLLAGRDNFSLASMGSIFLFMGMLWITEAIPLAITALLPLILFPLLGIANTATTASFYFNSIVFLTLGAFFFAHAFQKWNLHRRITYKLIQVFGSTPNKILLGLMASSTFLSMWISNTATAMMMLALGMAIIQDFTTSLEDKGKKALNNFTKATLLGIAYSTSIGGMATLIGTPPNLSLTQVFQEMFPRSSGIGFGQWMIFATPISLVFFAVTYFILTKLVFPFPEIQHRSLKFDSEHSPIPKRLSFEEKFMSLFFVVLVSLLIFKNPMNIGGLSIPGWSSFLPYAHYLNDASVMILMAITLFITPSRDKKFILTKDVFSKVPWEILLMFGGGFALAKGMLLTGLGKWIEFQSHDYSNHWPEEMILGVSTLMTFLTEIASNFTTSQMILPILASISKGLGVHPLILMVSGTLSASCAFLLPVASPPNMLVYGTGRLKIKDMLKAGFLLNLAGIVIIFLGCYYLLPLAFNFDINSFPDWAK